MPLLIGAEVAALRRLTAKELRQRFAELFGQPTRTGNKTWLIRRIAWRLQALALSTPRKKRRPNARSRSLGARPSRIQPWSRLTHRRWCPCRRGAQTVAPEKATRKGLLAILARR